MDPCSGARAARWPADGDRLVPPLPALATQAGARLLEVAGSFSDALALAGVLAERAGWANLTTTYVNPYMLEGDKTLGLELFEQLGGGAPASVIVPVGAGPLLAGIGKAYDELLAGGRDIRRPRLFGVQAAGCAPIARAFAVGEPVRGLDRGARHRGGCDRGSARRVSGGR